MAKTEAMYAIYILILVIIEMYISIMLIIKGKHLYIIHEMAEWHDPLRR